jgi:hypothetical protein
LCRGQRTKTGKEEYVYDFIQDGYIVSAAST